MIYIWKKALFLEISFNSTRQAFFSLVVSAHVHLLEEAFVYINTLARKIVKSIHKKFLSSANDNTGV